MAAKQKYSTALVVFSLTLFLSAALMFAVQPMVGKMLLPLVGGTPAGWVVAMAFFQVMLLAGYLLAHVMSKTTPVRHAVLYLAALAVGCFFLPIDLVKHLSRVPENPGAADVFLLLTFAVALPFIALSTTASTIQRLFTASGHESAKDPYFLYAASNVGSFSGLLLYPLLIEPLFTISAQANFLLGGYLLLIAAVAGCIFLARKNVHATPAAANKNSKPLPLKLCAEWALLAFIPSSLLMGSTGYITTDIVSVPMIWALPLCLYLLTFILAFGKKMPFSPARSGNIALFLIMFFIGSSMTKIAYMNGWSGAAIVMMTFFFAAYSCHARLATLRPLENAAKEITAFYLMMALGGAIGGVMNAFIVPYLFNTPREFHLVLLASLFLLPDLQGSVKKRNAFAVMFIIAILIINLPPLDLGDAGKLLKYAIFLVPGVVILLSIFDRTRPKMSSVALTTLALFILAQMVVGPEGRHLLTTRNFYGTIRVTERKAPTIDKEMILRYMQHGTTVHGLQVMDEKYKTTPTTYYTRKGPVGAVFNALNPDKVLVVGLGTGSVNCYAAPDRSFTFIEIDEAVVDVARKYFTFLDECKSKTPPRIIVGDGRLELAKLADEKFDLLLIDAFTSDSIPSHLLTQEAFSLYAERLSAGGIVLINISNRYLSLWDTIAASAAPTGFMAKLNVDFRPEESLYGTSSLWIALAREEDTMARLSSLNWLPIPAENSSKPWTDDYTNLLDTVPIFRKPFAYQIDTH